MGCSPLGPVEGYEITQEQLTAHLNNMPMLDKSVQKCVYCRCTYTGPDKGLPRCTYCGSHEIVTVRPRLARVPLT